MKLTARSSIVWVLAIGLLPVAAWAQMGPPGGGSSGPMSQGGPGSMMSCQALWSMGFPQASTALTMDQAAEAAQKYLALFGNLDLVPARIVDFTNHFQATVRERSTGANAFTLLIDKFTTGSVCWEPGPNMMWNTKYRAMGWGHMQGLPWWSGAPTTQMPVTTEQARQLTQGFLNAYLPETTVDPAVDTFYGFYDLYVRKDDKIIGMLSVNGYTGLVWYHTWHGPFMDMKTL